MTPRESLRLLVELCIGLALMSSVIVLPVLYARTGNVWVVIVPLVVGAAVCIVAVCMRSSQISRDRGEQ